MMNKSYLYLTFAVSLAMMTGLEGAAQSQPILVGVWRLDSYHTRGAAGRMDYPIGEHVRGQLLYDSRGNMSVHVMREDRPDFALNDFGRGTDTEVRAAWDGYLAYFGTYTEDSVKHTVTHHIRGALFPNFVGGDQVREDTFENGRLVLSTPPILWRGEPQEFVLVWEREP